MMFMRSGFVTLALPEFTAERINRAAVLVSLAPFKPFTPRERQTVRQFVENGGVFICTIGGDGPGGSRELLRDFGFTVGGDGWAGGGLVRGDPPPGPRAQPWGHFKSPYYNTGDDMAYVRFHAAWPVFCANPQARPLAYGPGNVPVILMLPVGAGKVIVVGDTGFAHNRNLENEGGQPFEGMRENADFWRWLIGYVLNREAYKPPPPRTPGPAPGRRPAATAPATTAPRSEPAEPSDKLTGEDEE